MSEPVALKAAAFGGLSVLGGSAITAGPSIPTLGSGRAEVRGGGGRAWWPARRSECVQCEGAAPS